MRATLILTVHLAKIARRRGYLARAQDIPPGNPVIWEGMSRLTDMQLGFMSVYKLVGNCQVGHALTILLTKLKFVYDVSVPVQAHDGAFR